MNCLSQATFSNVQNLPPDVSEVVRWKAAFFILLVCTIILIIVGACLLLRRRMLRVRLIGAIALACCGGPSAVAIVQSLGLTLKINALGWMTELVLLAAITYLFILERDYQRSEFTEELAGNAREVFRGFFVEKKNVDAIASELGLRPARVVAILRYIQVIEQSFHDAER